MAFDWKDWARPGIVGAVVAFGLPFANGLVSKLTFIPSTVVGGVSVPHGIIAAGVLAFLGTMLADTVAK